MNAKHAKRLRRAARSMLSGLPAVSYDDKVVKTVPHVQLQLQPDGTSRPAVSWIDKVTRRCSNFCVRSLYLNLKRDFPRPHGRLSPA